MPDEPLAGLLQVLMMGQSRLALEGAPTLLSFFWFLSPGLGVCQRPLTLILPQEHRATDRSHIVVRICGLFTTFWPSSHLCKSIAIETGGASRHLSINKKFQKYWGHGSMLLPCCALTARNCMWASSMSQGACIRDEWDLCRFSYEALWQPTSRELLQWPLYPTELRIEYVVQMTDAFHTSRRHVSCTVVVQADFPRNSSRAFARVSSRSPRRFFVLFQKDHKHGSRDPSEKVFKGANCYPRRSSSVHTLWLELVATIIPWELVFS